MEFNPGDLLEINIPIDKYHDGRWNGVLVSFLKEANGYGGERVAFVRIVSDGAPQPINNEITIYLKHLRLADPTVKRPKKYPRSF